MSAAAAPSGQQVTLSAGGYDAVVTEGGATLRTLTYGGRPLVAGFGAAEMSTSGRGQLLLPWPNRLQDGRYTFGGKEHQLPVTEVARGHASHGLVRWAAWTVRERSAAAVDLGLRLLAQPGYPWSLDLSARYTLSADGLTVTVTAANLSSEPAPFAAGAHPYLAVGGLVDDVNGWELDLPAATALAVDDRMIPTGRRDVAGTDLDFRGGRRIGDTALDTAFTDLERLPEGTVEVGLRRAEEAVTLWMDEAHRWVQVFAGRRAAGEPLRTALAVEPMTAPPNAFRSGEDLLVLAAAGESGDRRTFSWGIRDGGPTHR